MIHSRDFDISYRRAGVDSSTVCSHISTEGPRAVTIQFSAVNQTSPNSDGAMNI